MHILLMVYSAACLQIFIEIGCIFDIHRAKDKAAPFFRDTVYIYIYIYIYNPELMFVISY